MSRKVHPSVYPCQESLHRFTVFIFINVVVIYREIHITADRIHVAFKLGHNI